MSFGIPSNAASDKFTVLPSGLVTLRGPLNREEVSRYSVPILARSSKLLDIATLEVLVMDENDNSPEFRPGSCYTLAVPENQGTAVIHTIAAADLDEGKNGEIYYSIVGKRHISKEYFSFPSRASIYRLLSCRWEHRRQVRVGSNERCAVDVESGQGVGVQVRVDHLGQGQRQAELGGAVQLDGDRAGRERQRPDVRSESVRRVSASRGLLGPRHGRLSSFRLPLRILVQLSN